MLESKDCQKEDWLEWYLKGVQNELAGCAKYPQEAIALKAVDEVTGEIAGYAVWGWSARVYIFYFLVLNNITLRLLFIESSFCIKIV
jgi:hypothetical protein